LETDEKLKNLALIHVETCSREQDLIKSTIEREYYLDRATGQVARVDTVTVEDPHPNARRSLDKKVKNEIMPLGLLPAEIREKIKALMETEKDAPDSLKP